MGDTAREPPGHEQEESLSTGLTRQMEAVNAVQQQMANFVSDLSRLKTQCESLKRERTALLQDVATRESSRTSLDREIEWLRSQRDSLQIEFAALCEDEQYLRQAEAATSTELDASGRMARRLWLAGEKIKQLEQQVAEADGVRDADVNAEREVAAGLRQRIQRLERKLRESSSEAVVVKVSPDIEAEHQIAVLKDEVARLQRENADARSALAHETKARASALARGDELAEELQLTRDEIDFLKASNIDIREVERKLAKMTAERDQVASERDGLRAENGVLKRQPPPKADRPSSTPPVLQPISPNHGTPRTPTKGNLPATFDTPKHSAPSPNAPLSRQHAHLERQHAALKAAFDKLRSKYQNDLKHWKEYRAVDIARKQARQQRRDERRSTAAPTAQESSQLDAPSSSVAAPPHGTTSVAPPVQAPKRNSSDSAEKAEPDSKRTKTEPEASGVRPGAPRVVAEDVPQTLQAKLEAASASTPVRLGSTSTPSAVARQPSRVTPWLGAKTSSKKGVLDALDFEDEVSTPVRVRNPLVRDRTGDSSLRRSALVRVATSDAVASPTADPATPSSSKLPLDFGDLTPAQRAAERKRLSRLSTSERRELYAPYKGKGRYVAPEDMKRTVTDEFEIDPSRNSGVTHQFHEVVRGREERRKMHGGDCECCRDYYAAVGDLPRYYQAPAWKDDEGNSPQRGSRVDLEDHQNRISRHRETWRKPPTPPDYWKIGFPTTQDVAEVNAKADEMVAQREAEIRREAAHKDSKWRKKV